jgi:NAD(P)-dependent dehydrogenase (short-subunit alcohol dehydrogenase family)
MNLALLDSTRQELRNEYPGVEVEIFEVNVADEAAVDTAVQKTVERFGSIDIGVNCAGISGNPTSTHEMSLAEWNRVVAINQTGVWLCQRALIRQMLAQKYVISEPCCSTLLTHALYRSRGIREGRGVIVNVSSMFGVGGPPGPFGIPHYTAAKHGMFLSSCLV